MPLLDYLNLRRRTAGFRAGFGALRQPGEQQRPSTPQGSAYAGDLERWAQRTIEKVRTATVSGRIRFLPWFDPYTEETPEIRNEYRKMLIEPAVKAAFQTKVLSVISLEVQFQPVDDDDPRQQQQAKFMQEAFTRPGCNTRQIGWSVLHPAIIDGHSVCEKVWEPEPERSGAWRGKRFFRAVKSKDTRFLELGIDPYRNVIAIRGMGQNAGRVWSPSDFIVFSYLDLFENPAGMSDFRAAYRSYWIKNTAWQLRSLHLDKYTGPFLKGTYTTQDGKAALEDALTQARSNTWVTVPVGQMVDVIDLAVTGTTDFAEAIKDCDKEILIAIVGAHLQILEGQTPGGRGNTKVHKETSELIQWYLAATLTDIYRHDLVTPLSEENFHDLPPPLVSVGAVTEEAMLEQLRVDEGLQKIGLQLSKAERYRAYGRQEPTEADDVLQPMPGGGGGAGGAGGMPPEGPGGGGGGGGGSPFSEPPRGGADVRKHCMEGENKGMPGPCPEEGKGTTI